MVRLAVRDDLGKIAVLNEMVYMLHQERVPGIFKRYDARTAWESILEEFEQEDVWYVVAERQGEIVGYAKLEMRCIPEDHPVLMPGAMVHIDEMAVGRQRLGVGTELLAFIEEFARDRGIAAITLQVHNFNVSAKGLYAKSGFVPYTEMMRKKLY